MNAPAPIVRRVSRNDEAAWEAFVAAHPDAMLYHTWRYRRLLEAVTGLESVSLMATEAGACTGLLPLMACPGPYGVVYNSLPFFGSHGGVLATSGAAARALWSAYAALLDAPGVAAGTVVENPFAAAPGAPADVPGEPLDRRLAQFTRLDAAPDFESRLLARIDGSSRRNIRRAQLEGVVVRREEGALDFLEACHVANMAVIGGRCKPPVFFSALPDCLRPGRDFRLYVARIGGRPVAALLVLLFGTYVEYFTPVTAAEFRAAQPMAEILRVAMLELAGEGHTVWNWGGTWTTQDGVYRFKKKWGAEERDYRYFVAIRNPRLLAAADAAELTAAYGYFYVVPFGALASAARPAP